MFDSWLTLSGSGMDLKHIDRVMTPDNVPIGGRWGRPSKFATYRDPEGRFELSYPMGWELETGDAVVVRSKSIPAYARVEIGTGSEANVSGFEVSRRVLPRGTETIVLTTAVETGGTPVHSYAAHVLAAIRREFRVL
jgi:hypothetical protein